MIILTELVICLQAIHAQKKSHITEKFLPNFYKFCCIKLTFSNEPTTFNILQGGSV